MKNLTFIGDDYTLIRAAIQNPFPLSHWSENWPFFRPLVIFSLSINYHLSGVNAYGYYLTNLLIHIINTLLIFYLLNTIIVTDKTNQLHLSYIFSLFFFLNASSLSDVFWISGRTDLLAMTFILAVLIFIIKYIHSQRPLYLLFLFLFLVLGFMSKETLVIIVIFLPSIYFIKKKYLPEHKFYPAASVIIFTTLIYILYRFFIFGHSSFGESHSYSFYYLFKYSAYALWYTFIPFDFVDFLNFFFYDKWVFIPFGIIITSTAILFISYLYKTKSNIFLLLITLISIIISSIVYIYSFPALRLYYSILPLTYASLILTINIKSITKNLIVSAAFIFLIMVSGSVIQLYKITETNKYSIKYNNAIESNTNKKYILDLANVYMLGHHPVLANGNDLFSVFKSGKEVIIPYSINISLTGEMKNPVKYSIKDNNVINISVLSEKNIFLNIYNNNNNAGSPKFLNQTYSKGLGILLEPVEFSKNRENYLYSLNLVIPKQLLDSNINVMYFDENKISALPIKEFFNKFKLL